MELDHEEIVRCTEAYGGEWGLNHARRLLHLIDVIGAAAEYNREVIWVAAHLHDWGGFSQFMQEGQDHAARSTEVAAEFLSAHGAPEDFTIAVLECIQYHHQPDPYRSREAVLLCDADALDFLGVVGILRIFSKNRKELRKAFEIASKRRATLPEGLILPASRKLAAERVRSMDAFLAEFERDSMGCF